MPITLTKRCLPEGLALCTRGLSGFWMLLSRVAIF
jgi:hypothetical protein